METTVNAHRAGALSQRAQLSAIVAADGVLAVID
jgi:acetyl-CoA/propionyl-CoA carboxylase biotin carboxyl carrier protein